MSFRWRHPRRPAGQALVELAIAAPVVLSLLAGSAQVGVIAYVQVSLDTAVREGARVAADNPASLRIFSAGAPKLAPDNEYPCSPSDPNLVCTTIYRSTQNGIFGGLIDTGNLRHVSVTAAAGPSGVLAPCPGAGPSSTQDGLLTVHAEYRAPVFLPFAAQLLADPGQSYRTVRTTVTVRVDPCSVTQGN